MASDLFRKEAIAARQNDWLGSICLQPPRLGWGLFGLGLVTTTVIICLLISSKYTRHERVEGTLVPSKGIFTITPATTGVVKRLVVNDGDKVYAGQPLVEISGEQDSATLGSTYTAIAAQLLVKRSKLTADLNEQQQLFSLQRKDTQSRLFLLRNQISQTKQQIAIQLRRIKSAETLYGQWLKASNSGVVSKIQVLQQHDNVLQDQADLNKLNAQSFQLQQQAQELQGQLDQLPVTMLSKHNETERELADVAQSLSQNAAKGAVLLRAPSDGVVANVLVHAGQSVTADQPLMTVLPAKSDLMAEFWVPTKAVGFISPDERVVMRYHAYPYQKFGQRSGRVRNVSRSAVSAAELSKLLGQDIKSPRYRVQVALDSQSVLAYGHVEELKPGMTLDADVLMDQRSLIEWLFEPINGFTRGLDDNSVTTKVTH